MVALLAQRVFPLLLWLVNARNGDGGVHHSIVYHAGVGAAEAVDRIKNNTFRVASLSQNITSEHDVGRKRLKKITLACRMVTDGVNWLGWAALPGEA